MAKLSNEEIINKSEDIRNQLELSLDLPIDIFAECLKIKNITIVERPLSENISGICIKGNSSSCIIEINSTMSYGRKRFTLAHELYHYYFSKEAFIVCNKSFVDVSDEESNANHFASYFLMPKFALRKFIKEKCDDKIELTSILAMENYFQVSRKTLLIRLKSDKRISEEEMVPFTVNIIINAKKNGYSDKLYVPEEGEKKTTLGEYIRLCEALLDKDLISKAKYEELLLDAGRADIVFGEEKENYE
ncbi:MAG: ImmA/IrrE family metallo-endopeptidase [Firmicutes bacterium]|nr:ImmA/IrrE family metallo-endopeptidase [Bacillota bacterium]